jgi:hypothetical protein
MNPIERDSIREAAEELVKKAIDSNVLSLFHRSNVELFMYKIEKVVSDIEDECYKEGYDHAVNDCIVTLEDIETPERPTEPHGRREES